METLHACAQSHSCSENSTGRFVFFKFDCCSRGILYMDIPSAYRWIDRTTEEQPQRHWRRRVNNLTYPTIGRIYSVSRSRVSDESDT